MTSCLLFLYWRILTFLDLHPFVFSSFSLSFSQIPLPVSFLYWHVDLSRLFLSCLFLCIWSHYLLLAITLNFCPASFPFFFSVLFLFSLPWPSHNCFLSISQCVCILNHAFSQEPPLPPFPSLLIGSFNSSITNKHEVDLLG